MNKIKIIFLSFLLMPIVSYAATKAPMGSVFLVANMDNSQLSWNAQNSSVINQPAANPINSMDVYTFIDPTINGSTTYTLTFTGIQSLGRCVVTYNINGIVSILNYVGSVQCKQVDAWHLAIL